MRDEINSKERVLDERRTISVPEAGRWLGLGKNASYAACARGDIPFLRIGRLLRVPVAAMEAKLAAAGVQPKAVRQ